MSAMHFMRACMLREFVSRNLPVQKSNESIYFSERLGKYNRNINLLNFNPSETPIGRTQTSRNESKMHPFLTVITQDS